MLDNIKTQKGRVHATDYSNFSATGMWDPFIMQLNSFAFYVRYISPHFYFHISFDLMLLLLLFLPQLLDIPYSILPKIMDTSGFFGNCIASVFGEDNKIEVPITAMAADQQAGDNELFFFFCSSFFLSQRCSDNAASIREMLMQLWALGVLST